MRMLKISSIPELVDLAVAEYDSKKNVDYIVTILCRDYDTAKDAIFELVQYGFDINTINLKDPAEYNKEYLITICDDAIDAEPAFNGNRYIINVSNILYVINGCSEDAVLASNTANSYLVLLESDDECDGHCGNCKEDTSTTLTLQREGHDVHGVSMTRGSEGNFVYRNFYTSKVLSDDDIHKIVEFFKVV